MYGTRAKSCWGKADGFDCYTSTNLVDWDGPFEIFHRPKDFWADQNFWAPECIFYRGNYFLIATFGKVGHKGIQILSAKSPLGPFVPITQQPITPPDWNCIDGTVFIEEKPYLIFSHSFEDVPEGDMCMMELSEDLMTPASEIVTLFSAKDAPWATPVPFAKQEFGMDGDVFFTDGPTVHRTEDGKLFIIWSSWGEGGYSVGCAISDSDAIKGPWRHLERTLFERDGGHGMLFETKEGQQKYVLHYPNEKGKEHPVFLDMGNEKY